MNGVPSPDPAEETRLRRRRGRNLAVFFTLLAFVALVYAVTIVKIKLAHGS
jgi:hypothetical protein